MIVTYDGQTMSACVYGGHIFESEYKDGTNVVMAAVGDYEPARACFDALTPATSADAVAAAVEGGDAMVLHNGKLVTMAWSSNTESGIDWVEVSPPYAIASNKLLSGRAVELMRNGMNASQACSQVIAEVAEAGGMVNTQTV